MQTIPRIPSGVLESAYKSTLSLKELLEMFIKMQSGEIDQQPDEKVLAQLDDAKNRMVGLLAVIRFSPPIEVADDT